MKRLLIPAVLICVLSPVAFGGERISLSDLKMQKRFGIGFSAGGPLSVLGIEADVNVTPDFSVSGGIGTGLDYSTFMVKARYLLLGQSVSPYVAAGFARWWTDGTKERALTPSVLTSDFLPAGYDPSKGFSVFMLYPAIGVEYMHPFGVAVFVEAQYLFQMFSFSNGTYAGMGVHWYF